MSWKTIHQTPANPSDTCSLLFWYKKDGYWENWLMECENSVKSD